MSRTSNPLPCRWRTLVWVAKSIERSVSGRWQYVARPSGMSRAIGCGQHERGYRFVIDRHQMGRMTVLAGIPSIVGGHALARCIASAPLVVGAANALGAVQRQPIAVPA